MALINPQVPVIGQPNSTEEPKITSAINTITTAVNGNLDNANIKTGANINGSKLLDGSVTAAQLANDAVTSDKVNLSYTEDVLDPATGFIYSGSEQFLWGGADRVGGVSLLIATLNLDTSTSNGRGSLYLNVFSGSNVRYVTQYFGNDNDEYESVTMACITPASALWSPNITVHLASGQVRLLAGSRITSVRIS
jgi:hypothetical protein